MIFQLASYIAESGNAAELRANQLSIANFAKEMSEKTDEKVIIGFLSERLHKIINRGDDTKTKTTIRLLNVASASLHLVFTIGIADSIKQDIPISS